MKYLLFTISFLVVSCGPSPFIHLEVGSTQIMTNLRARGLLWGKDGNYQDQLRREIRDTMEQTCKNY